MIYGLELIIGEYETAESETKSEGGDGSSDNSAEGQKIDKKCYGN